MMPRSIPPARGLSSSLPGVATVHLELLSGAREPTKTLIRVGNTASRAEFRWRRNLEGWRVCLDLCEGLIPESHQYMTHEGVDDALLEIAFMENWQPSADKSEAARNSGIG
jgi:hypothetical protein